jgi:hypothetical protein
MIVEQAESCSETEHVSRTVLDVLNDKFIVHESDLKFLLDAFRTSLTVLRDS